MGFAASVALSWSVACLPRILQWVFADAKVALQVYIDTDCQVR